MDLPEFFDLPRPTKLWCNRNMLDFLYHELNQAYAAGVRRIQHHDYCDMDGFNAAGKRVWQYRPQRSWVC